jgi:antitoxin component HigA of HigAB toxin-antitoxin module
MVVRDADAKEKRKKESETMTDGFVGDFDELTPAWQEFETHTPVKLRAIETERHFRAMVKFMNELVDKIGDREDHPLMGLLDIVTAFVHEYEERNVEIPDATPSVVLRFLMAQHGLRQARALAKRFGVSPAVFI